MSEEIEVPPFDAGHHTPKIYYYWWSWNPFYPYWSKSCWGGETIEEAQKDLNENLEGAAHSMYNYHNKLIQEGIGGGYIEVLDMPCEHKTNWKNATRN